MTIGVTHTASTGAAFAQPCATAVTSDAVLLAQIAGGDRLAMRNLYVRHQRRVFRFVVRMLGDRCLTEDVLSEVFFEVWKKAEHFQGRSSVSTWLLGIARHKALTAAATKSRTFESLDGVAATKVLVDLGTFAGAQELMHQALPFGLGGGREMRGAGRNAVPRLRLMRIETPLAWIAMKQLEVGGFRAPAAHCSA